MSLALDAPMGFGVGGKVTELPIGILRLGEAVRSGGLDEAHVALLMECVDQWPPIVVWGDDCTVLDGCHRVEAARRLGRFGVRAVRFEGSSDDAFIEAVRSNVNHGLPLSVSDRRRAARRVLARNPEWSDRRIASVCGLSDKTVARLRRAAGGSVVSAERRIGRDGKVRPVQPGDVRDRVRRALEDNPAGSLRAIAAVAGASPETVRSVRASLVSRGGCSGGARPLALVSKGREMSARPVLSLLDEGEETDPADRQADDDWLSDYALKAIGDDFARWFAETNVTDDWHRFVWTIPLGRIYPVVDEARRRATAWTSFASLLESRTR